MGKDKFLTLKEAAGRLRVSERSLYRYIHSGRLRASKVGYWRIPQESYEKFLRDNANFQAEVEKHRRKKKQ